MGAPIASNAGRGPVISEVSVPPGDRALVLAEARDTMEERKQRLVQLQTEVALLEPDAPYRALYRIANFTPAQIEQFRMLIEKQRGRRAELVASTGSRRPAAAAQQEIRDQLAAELIVDARELFGDATARQIDHYFETTPLRDVTTRLAGNLYYSDSPLTATQTEQLLTILARHSRNPNGVVDIAVMNLEAALPEMATVLSPGQFAEMRALTEHFTAKKNGAERK